MKRLPLLSTILVSAFIGVASTRGGSHVYDDAFITMRYARNLAEGNGLVYNVGENVLGTSAPLFALLLAGPARLLGPDAIPAVSVGIGLSALLLTALLLLRLLAPIAPAAVAVLAVAAALTPLETARVFASGMETPLYLAALAGALLLASRGRDAAAFLVAGCLPFLHPDGALLFVALAVAFGLRDRRIRLRPMLPGAALALLLAGTLTALFGSPVPHSVVAKRVAYPEAPFTALGALARSSVEVLLPPRVPDLAWPAPPPVAFAWEAGAPLLALVLLAALFRSGRRALLRPEIAAAAIFAGAYLLAFAAANPLVFPWYEAPLGVGLAIVVGALAGEASRGGPSDRIVARVGAAVLLAGTLLRLALFEPYPTADREAIYRTAALRMGASPSEVVLAPEIGALGFYSRARIWDTAGLVTPEALRFRDEAWRRRESGPEAIGGGTIPPGAIEAVRPDWVVGLSRFVDPLLRVRPSSLDGYELVAEYPTTRWASRAVLVYRRSR